jgi:hypothetical protein
MPAVIVDNSRARSAGWSPKFTFEEGLVGVWEEWSQIDHEAVLAGSGAVGVPGTGEVAGAASAVEAVPRSAGGTAR